MEDWERYLHEVRVLTQTLKRMTDQFDSLRYPTKLEHFELELDSILDRCKISKPERR